MLSSKAILFVQKPSLSCLGMLTNQIQNRGLKIHPSDPPKNVALPDSKGRLPPLAKIPNEFANELKGVKIPRGTRENYRKMGEEKVHTDLLLGQYGIVAVHGGSIKSATFEALRIYIGRKLKKGKAFAMYRVDPPYKVKPMLMTFMC